MIETTFSDIRDKLYMLMLLNEDALTGERISGVSKQVYPDALPTTLPVEIKECVMLDFESAISNFNAYGYGTIRVWLVAPDKDMGSTLAVMEKYFNESIADYSKSTEAGDIEFHPRFTYSRHDPNRKLRSFVKELTVKIKK